MSEEAEPVTKPEIARPTDNYRRHVVYKAGGFDDVIERCWIVGDKLEWRPIEVVEGEADEVPPDA